MIDVWEIPIPPLLGLCLYICLSSLPHPSLPHPSVSATVMLSPSLCVCRQEVTQCLTEARQRDKLISQQTHRRGNEEEDGGGVWRREGGVQNKTDKRQNAKTLLKHQAMGVLLNSKPPPSFTLWAAVPSTTHTHPHALRHTTPSDSAGSAGAPVFHQHTQESKYGGPDIWSILTLINWGGEYDRVKDGGTHNKQHNFRVFGKICPWDTVTVKET